MCYSTFIVRGLNLLPCSILWHKLLYIVVLQYYFVLLTIFGGTDVSSTKQLKLDSSMTTADASVKYV